MAAASVVSGPRIAVPAFIYVTAVLDVVAIGIVIPVVPKLIEGFTGDPARAGFVNGLFVAIWGLMQLLASPLLGALSDRFGRRPVLLVSTAALGLDYVLMAVAPNLWWLVVGRVLGGLTSANMATVTAFIADVTSEEERSRAYGRLGAALSAGFVVGPVLGGVLGEIGPRVPFWVAAALSALAFVYGALVLPESLPPEKRAPFAWSNAHPLGAFRLLAATPTLLRLSIVGFCMIFCHFVFHAVFVLFLLHRHGLGSGAIGALFSFSGLLDVAVQTALVERCVARWGDARTMRLGLATGALGLVAFGLSPGLPALLVSIVIMSLWGLSQPTLQALMTREVGPSEQGRLQGASQTSLALAGVIGPLVWGGLHAALLGTPRYAVWGGAPFVVSGVVLGITALLATVGTRTETTPPA